MIDPKIIRKNRDLIASSLYKRSSNFDLDYFIELDIKVRKIQSNIEDMRSKKNLISKDIGSNQLLDNEKEELKTKMKSLNKILKESEDKISELMTDFNYLSKTIPNILHESVPSGNNESDNLEIKKWGEPKISNDRIKDHVELGEQSGEINFEEASKLSGSRFTVIKNNYAKLHRALIAFMLDHQTNNNGYTEHYVPSLVKSRSLEGTGQLPKFESDLFKIDGDQDFYLIPTAEVPLTNLIRDRIVDETELPIKMVAHTPCFRSEAGSYGQDTKGMIRQHQFEKVELVQIVKPEESYDALEELTNHAESILKKLELPYRVVLLCAGDTGDTSAKTYDIEVWLPSQNRYREISSCSNCESFQSRRIKARWKNNISGKSEYLHTLNGSGLAVGRTFIAVIENYQQEDGSIIVPKALRAYMDNKEVI
ncbi:MAG: serine--tRNA ligase [Gammaproteobacteria bacterium]|nr:serine--tRNA ligase [Gammaproteobacteria bacterium]